MQQVKPLPERYHVLHRVAAEPSRSVWLAEDVLTRALVVVVQVPSTEAPALTPAIGVQHPHLASLLAVFDPVDASRLPDATPAHGRSAAAVAQWASGRTMHEAVKEQTLPPTVAVRTVASITSAVAALHAKGAVHGAVCSRNVLLDRLDGGVVPLLLQASCVPDGSFASPERLVRTVPSALDDVWALHVLLYAALTGRRPFLARTRETLRSIIESVRPLPLSAFGLEDSELQALLNAGLVRDPALRTRRVGDLEARLFDWLAAYGDPSDPGNEDDCPPTPHAPQLVLYRDNPPSSEGPLRLDLTSGAVEGAAATQRSPESADEVDATDVPPPSSRSVGSLVALGLASQPALVAEAQTMVQIPHAAAVWPKAAAVLVGVGIVAVTLGGIALSRLSDGTAPARTNASSGPLAAAVAAAPASGAAGATTRGPASGGHAPQPTPSGLQGATPAQRSACVAAYFPPSAFRRQVELSFVCEERDPRAGARRLRQALVLGGEGALTQGMEEWEQLAWHQLAAFAMLRAGCCPAPPPLELPPPVAGCSSVQAALNALAATHARRGSDVVEKLDAFGGAARCAVSGRDTSYAYREPVPVSQNAFEKFRQRAEAR